MSGRKIWLGDAQVGHWVVLYTTHIGGSAHGIARIDRATKTRLHAAGNAFSRKSGFQIGSNMRNIGQVFETEAEARDLFQSAQARERARIAAVERNQRALDGLRHAVYDREPVLSVERMELAAEVIRALVGREGRGGDPAVLPCDDATAERLLSIVRGVE